MNKKLLAFGAIISIIVTIIFGWGPAFSTPENADNRAGAEGYEEISFKTDDSEVRRGWFIRAQTPKKGTIIYLHVYSDKISTRIDNVLWLKDAGYDIFAFDYRGSGRTGVAPSLKEIHLATERAIETAFNIPGVKGDRVFVLGQSLGGAASIYAVANSRYKKSISGLIIDSSFSSYLSLTDEKLKDLGVFRPCMEGLAGPADVPYSPARWIHDISPVPVIIVHGETDETIPLRSALELYDRAARPKELLIADDKGHLQALTDRDIRRRLASNLASVN